MTRELVRTHLSHKPITELRDRRKDLYPERKPVGFWYNVDGDWEGWVRDRGIYAPNARRYRVELKPRTLLRIRTHAGIQQFFRRYKAPGCGPAMSIIAGGIDWPRVAERWAGIEIAPYLGMGEHHEWLQWYYGWDVASGCVWDPPAAGVTFTEISDDA